MLKKIRIVTFALAAIFAWGVVGSLELERIALSEAIGYIGAAIIFCAAAVIFELALKTARLLVVGYVRRKRRESRTVDVDKYCLPCRRSAVSVTRKHTV